MKKRPKILMGYLLALLLVALLLTSALAATKLNTPLVAGGNVWGHQISADSNWVVYRADQDTDEVYELYSVPIDGGTPTKLNAPLVTGGDVEYPYQISADSSRVVYRVYQYTDNVYELRPHCRPSRNRRAGQRPIHP